MTTATQAVIANNAPGYVRRQARTLIDWLTEEEGTLWIAGRQMVQEQNQEYIDRCRAARDAVESRQEGCNQDNLFSPISNELYEHVQALRDNPKTAQVIAEAGEPQMVDLRRLIAAQPTILAEEAANRVRGLVANDILRIAAITIPLHTTTTMQVIFDQNKNAFIFSSPNPNLRVAGKFGGEVAPGVQGFGFVVDIASSFMQVAGIGGRYFLRDGYHRAYGLLEAGINFAPALVREYNTLEEIQLPAGLLPQSAYLGPRPPLLVDYLDDTVATDTHLPVLTKMVIIQAIDVTSMG